MSMNSKAELKTDRFETAALAHIDSIYRFALYMAENESDAQDLVQNTYLEAYRSFDRLEEDTNYKAWLLTISNDKFINTTHRDKRQVQMTHPSSDKEGREIELSGDADPGKDIPEDPLGDKVAAAMSDLPAKYRAVVLLADMEGLSYNEVAGITDSPIETVMSRLYRARMLLKKKLRNWGVQRIEAAAMDF